MDQQKRCKRDGTLLVKKETQRKPSQLLQPYYYSAYYKCPQCDRIYHDNSFKVLNQNYELFTTDALSEQSIEVEIWTDGACVNNGKPTANAAWGFVSGEYEANGLVEGKQTNNRAEGFAVYYALKWACEKGHKRIKIYTDSQITIHGVSKSPEKVKENRDIFILIHAVISKNTLSVLYEKVLGHSGDINNERADKMANSLAMK